MYQSKKPYLYGTGRRKSSVAQTICQQHLR